MAKIVTNTSGSQPSLWLTTTFTTGTPDFTDDSGILSVICLQDITMTNSTGIFSWTDFCNLDTQKLPAPADNSISTNVVIDDAGYFGNSGATANSAQFYGIQRMSDEKTLVGFRVYWNDRTGVGATSKYRQGTGYITNLAPTVSPEAPVWVSPVEIAVSGGFTTGSGAL